VFIKSLLYNQIPMTAFLNKRSMLAGMTILMGFIFVSFMMPFFSLMRDRRAIEVSLQVTGALLIFFVATLVSAQMMKCIGPKRISCLALSLATIACFILSQADSQVIVDESSEAQKFLRDFLDSFMFYFDGAIGGYLLICVAAAFLTTASFEEVMGGTRDMLQRTKFKETTGSQLFVEAASSVQSLIQISILIGPILGGFLNESLGMQMTCF